LPVIPSCLLPSWPPEPGRGCRWDPASQNNQESLPAGGTRIICAVLSDHAIKTGSQPLGIRRL
jgi:hypothetical protein